jgi:hypothetical protein
MTESRKNLFDRLFKAKHLEYNPNFSFQYNKIFFEELERNYFRIISSIPDKYLEDFFKKANWPDIKWPSGPVFGRMVSSYIADWYPMPKPKAEDDKVKPRSEYSSALMRIYAAKFLSLRGILYKYKIDENILRACLVKYLSYKHKRDFDSGHQAYIDKASPSQLSLIRRLVKSHDLIRQLNL